MRNRFVLLLGRSGAGKSTVANHLVGHDPLSPDKPPFRVSNVLGSATREVTHKTVEFMWENDLYRVTVVDTLGVFDTEFGDRPNDIIFEKIEEYIEETKLRIDLILFVFMRGRFTAEDKKMFSFFMTKFRKNRGIPGCPKEISSISALVITACENDGTISITTREQLVQEFEVYTREIADQMGMGIYPVGFPPLKRMRQSE